MDIGFDERIKSAIDAIIKHGTHPVYWKYREISTRIIL